MNCDDPSGHWPSWAKRILGGVIGKVIGGVIGIGLISIGAPVLIGIGVGLFIGGALGGYIGIKISGFNPIAGTVVGGMTTGLPFLPIPTTLIGSLDIIE